MILRSLIALVALATPAAADFIVSADLTIDPSNVPIVAPGDSIRVVNSATLTIQDAADGIPFDVFGDIVLSDRSSLIIRGGTIRGDIIANGNNRLEFRGGSHRQSVAGIGNVSVLIDGNASLGSNFEFDAGTQTYEIRHFNPHPTAGFPEFYKGGSDDTLNVYSSTPEFHFPSGTFYELGLFHGGTVNVWREINWRIYDTTGRPDGDANLDGIVDLADLNIVRGSLGMLVRTNLPWSTVYGDTLPFDGELTLDDLNRVRNNFGNSRPVPEPHSLALMALGFFALAGIPSRYRWCSFRRRQQLLRFP